jgi:hypothetical protein
LDQHLEARPSTRSARYSGAQEWKSVMAVSPDSGSTAPSSQTTLDAEIVIRVSTATA